MDISKSVIEFRWHQWIVNDNHYKQLADWLINQKIDIINETWSAGYEIQVETDRGGVKDQ